MKVEEIAAVEKSIEGLADKTVQVDKLNKLAYDSRNIDPKRSFEIGEKAFAIAEAQEYKKGKAASLGNLGFSNLHFAKHEVAFKQLMESLKLYEEEVDDEAGKSASLYNIGILHLRVGNLDQAIENLHKSLAIREKLDDKSGQAACYFQIAYIHQYFNDIDASYSAAIKSLELRRAINDKVGEASALMVLSDTYIKRKEFDKAKEAIELSLSLRSRADEKLGYYSTQLRLAEVYFASGEYEKALKVSEEGEKGATSEDVQFGTIRFLQMQGKVELHLKNLDKALKHYKEALALAQKLQYKSIEYELHESLTEIYRLKEDYKNAFENYKRYHALKEEVVSMQSNTRMKSMQFMNEVESAKREAEIEKSKNEELKKANEIIEEKNKDITDSIRYARRIQTSILPKNSFIESLFPQSFVLYKPKDIVSGDFYWAANKNGKKIIVAADCTGHGVPGAFMSMTGSTLLNEIVNEKAVTCANEILNRLRERLMQTLQQTGADGESKDGMDIALCVIEGNQLEFAGANNPLYLVRNGELIEYKGDKQPIGIHVGEQKPFMQRNITLQKGDSVYIFTDGYADQFGGPKGKKFLYKRFQELLLAESSKTPQRQRDVLDRTIEEWKRGGEQIDDILVIGVKI